MRALLALLLTLAAPVAAQEVLGQLPLDDRTITVFDDGTWEYADIDPDDCQLIARDLSFCGDRDIWEETTPPNNDIAATFQYDTRHFGQMIIEELGTDDGLTAPFMRDVVIENAAVAINGTTDDVTVLETYRTQVSGQTSETIVYALKFDGLDVVYANGIVTAPNRTLQLMTFAIATEYTDKHRDLHEEFLSAIRIAK